MLTKADIEKYFMAEKQVGLTFFIIGIIAIVLAIVFFLVVRTNFYKGAAIPLLVVGLLELIMGFMVFRRSDGDRVRNVYAFDMNPGELKEKELPRMQKVLKGFAVFKRAEIILIVAALVLIVLYRARPDKVFWLGLGISLGIQALILLGTDYLAEKRAKEYTTKLQAFTG